MLCSFARRWHISIGRKFVDGQGLQVTFWHSARSSSTKRFFLCQARVRDDSGRRARSQRTLRKLDLPATFEPLARRAGNSAEMTRFISEKILGTQWTASKGSDPRTAPGAPSFEWLRDCLEVFISSHSVPSFVAGRGRTLSKRTCRTLPKRIGLPFTSSVERFVFQLQLCFQVPPDVHQRTGGQGARMDLTGQLIALMRVSLVGPSYGRS